jgi:PAS domain S-box-containing protein
MIITTMRLFMNKHLRLGILSLLAGLVGICISLHPMTALSENLKLNVLKSASELDYPPFAIVQPDGTVDGFSVDLLKAAVKAGGLTISFKVDSWHVLKQELADGTLDVLPLVSYSKERDKVYDFTAPYMKLNGTVFVRKGNTEIQKLADLMGKEVLVMRGDTAHEYVMRKKLTGTVIPTESIEEAFKLLAAGKYDAVVVQQIVGFQMLRKLKIDNVVPIEEKNISSIKPVSLKLDGFEQKFCFAVRDGNQQLLSLLNEGLAVLYLDGTYEALYEKWFSPIMPKPEIPIGDYIKLLFSIIVPLLLIGTLFGLWYLNRLVATKTRFLEQEIEHGKLMEKEKEEANAKYIKAQELGKVGNWEYSVDTREFWISSEAKRIFGLNRDSLRFTIEEVESCIPERERVHQALIDLIEKNIPYNLEFDTIARDTGERRIITSLAELDRDETGKPVKILGVIQEITERKQAEEYLQESEQRHREYIQNTPYGVFVTDEQGRYTQVNPAASYMTGYNEQELLAMSSEDLLPQESQETALRYFQQLHMAGKYQGNILYRTKNGEKRWWSITAVKISDTRFLGFCNDITERKKSEEALKRIEWMLSTKIDTSVTLENADPYCGQGYGDLTALNRNGCIAGFVDPEILQGIASEYMVLLETSSAIYEKNGYYAFGIFTSSWCRLMDSASRKLCGEEDDVAALASGKWLCHESCWTDCAKKVIDSRQPVDIACRGGIRLYGVPIFAGKEVIGVINFGYGDPPTDPAVLQSLADSYALDFDKLVRTAKTYDSRPPVIVELAKKRLQTSAQLIGVLVESKQSEEENKNLQAQLQQAQKMEAIGTLAGGIAHDFNNILGAILGYAEMAQEDSPAGSVLRRDIDQIVKAGHRARELVKQILAFSRQGETEHIALQPAFIIQEAIKMLRSSLPSTITIKQNIDMDAGLILASPTQIHQIVMNLCTNAFHAMEKAGGTLAISLEKKTLDEKDIVDRPGLQSGDFVQLSIGDTGPGIAPELWSKIFDPYFTTKEVGKGTGMGLAIIHGIVKSYGGCVSFTSKTGKGAVFEVLLPVMAEGAVVENKQEEIVQCGSERILFIDDEEFLAEMSKSMLERLGYQVTVQSSSLEGLTIFQNQPDKFDLVITDQTMPGMTGIDMARRMLQIRPGMPIILCTGYSSLISEDKAKSIGIKGFALKPLAWKSIAALIREVLDGGRRLSLKL